MKATGLDDLHSAVSQTVSQAISQTISQIEAAIVRYASVCDCAVLVRPIEQGQSLVAYVVPTAPFTAEALHNYLQTQLPDTPLPDAYVPLSSLPLTPEGQLDRESLLQLEVIDPALVHRWEAVLRSHPEIEQAAVVVQTVGQASIDSPAVLHLSDLLPDWKGTIASRESIHPIPLDPPSVDQLESLTSFSSQRLSICHGEPLILSSDAPMTLVDVLQQTVLKQAALQPATLQPAALDEAAKGITYLQADGSEQVQSYTDLLTNAQRVLAGLRDRGVQPQSAVIFQFEQPQAFITAFWACQLGGFVPIPIAPVAGSSEAISMNKLGNTWNLTGQPLVLTDNDRTAAAIAQLPGLSDLPIATLEALQTFEPDPHGYTSQPEDTAVFFLTSGSTGAPKLVTQSHFSLLQQIAANIQRHQFSQAEVSLNWLPLDHVGGLIMFHLRDLYLGCQQIHATMLSILQNPLQWLHWIDRYRVTVTWAPNFAYELVNRQLEKSHLEKSPAGTWDLSCLKWACNGGEAIVAKQSREFLQRLMPYGLSATAMYPAWGMSETCSGTIFSDCFSLDSTTDDDPFVEVGAPLPGFSIRIVDGSGAIVPEGTVGQLQVGGACLTAGYYQNAAANQEAFTADGWFNTGDLGRLREGQLTLTGRQKDVIIINGLNYYSHQIESVVDAIPGVEPSYTAAIAVRTADSATDQLVILFSPSSPDPIAQTPDSLAVLLTTIRQQVMQSVGINPTHVVPVEPSAIPKTSIGKIQRSQLKQAFERGEFDPHLKQLDLQLKNHNTLPNWFYRRIWQRKDYAVKSTPRSGDRSGKVLIFIDQAGLGEAIGQQLEQQQRAWIAVERGDRFAAMTHNRYCLSPDDPQHYQQLITAAIADGVPITHILHLWTYDNLAEPISSIAKLEQAQIQGVYSLLFLTQALMQVQGSQQPVQLQIGSSHTQTVTEEDPIAYEKSPILGLLKTIPDELPWIQARHVDLPPVSVTEPLESLVQVLLQELSMASDDREVAYRQGQRLVDGLQPIDFTQVDPAPLPLQTGGLYLITGGLGGIGVEIAQDLLQRYQAKLLLIGTTPLPERKTWQSHLLRNSPIADRIRTLQQLERLSGAVKYEAVDVSELEQLRSIVEQAEAEWQQPLDGVLHLAGVHYDVMLRDLTQPILADSLRPKVTGSWVLQQILRDRPQGLFIAFSSVNGYLGGKTVAAYAAANRFHEAFTAYQNRHSSVKSYCFSWSMWDDIGMSRNYPTVELTRARGFHTITPQQGLASLQAALSHHQHQVFIGLDGTNPHLQSWIQGRSHPLQRLSAYVVGSTGRLDGEIELVRDRFGTSSHCSLIPVQVIPSDVMMGGTAIDRAPDHPQDTAQSPRYSLAALEQEIAEIWQTVLELPKVGRQESFFDLGGHSVLLAQVERCLHDRLGVTVSTIDLFRYPTIQDLAQFLSQTLNPPAVDPDQSIPASESRTPRMSVQQRQQLRQRSRQRS